MLGESNHNASILKGSSILEANKPWKSLLNDVSAPSLYRSVFINSGPGVSYYMPSAFLPLAQPLQPNLGLVNLAEKKHQYVQGSDTARPGSRNTDLAHLCLFFCKCRCQYINRLEHCCVVSSYTVLIVCGCIRLHDIYAIPLWQQTLKHKGQRLNPTGLSCHEDGFYQF